MGAAAEFVVVVAVCEEVIVVAVIAVEGELVPLYNL